MRLSIGIPVVYLKRGISVEIFQGGLSPRGNQPGRFDHWNVRDIAAGYSEHAESGFQFLESSGIPFPLSPGLIDLMRSVFIGGIHGLVFLTSGGMESGCRSTDWRSNFAPGSVALFMAGYRV